MISVRSSRRSVVLACVALLAAVTASARHDLGTASASATSCPSFRDAREAARIHSAAIDEVSGVVASSSRPLLWIHEDSGNGPWLYGVRPDGTVVTKVEVSGATNRDWEDLAISGDTLWIGDIGDNRAARSEIQVYRVAEPAHGATRAASTMLRYRYPDTAHDAEALIVDVRRDALFIVTKELAGGTTRVYRGSIGDPSDGRLRTLERVGSVGMAPVTGAARSPEGIVLRTYTAGLLFRWRDDRRVMATLGASPCAVPVGGGESLAYRAADRRFYAIPEGGSPPIRVTAPA